MCIFAFKKRNGTRKSRRPSAYRNRHHVRYHTIPSAIHLTRNSLTESIQTLHNENEKWTLSSLSLDEALSASSLSIANDAKQLYNCTEAQAQTHLLQITTEFLPATSQSQAQSALISASNGINDWKQDRQTSKYRKAGAHLQKFLTIVSSFLNAFKGIAEIVKAVDQSAGGIAYGSVILLAATGAIKQQREDAVEDMLEELAYAFPRINTLKELYRKPQLQTLIVNIFELTIKFCREVSSYFAKRSLGRVKQVFVPDDEKAKIAARLRKKLNQLRQEGEILMHEKLEEARWELSEVRIRLQETTGQLKGLEQLNKDIQSTGNDTNQHVRENHKRLIDAEISREKKTYLDELRNLLGLDKRQQSPGATCTLLKSKLEREFSEHRRRGHGDPQLLTPEILLAEPTYASWLQSKKSAICLLSGTNLVDDASVQLNWLSATSTYTYEHCPADGIILGVFCQTDYVVNKRHQLTFSTVMSSLIVQLAATHPTGLKHRRENIQSAIRAPDWGAPTSGGYAAMTRLFADLLEDFEQGETVTIVIDRLDQCYWGDENEVRAEVLDGVISSLLLDLISNEDLKHLKIKLLLVMDCVPAMKIRKNFDWAIPRPLMCRLEWDQEVGDED